MTGAIAGATANGSAPAMLSTPRSLATWSLSGEDVERAVQDLRGSVVA